MKLLRIIFCLFLIGLTSCESLALLTTPKKHAIPSNDTVAKLAEFYFWKILHAGEYQHIDQGVRLLMVAYLRNPNDPKLAAHLGFLHMWKITERSPLNANPGIPDEIILAKKYFNDALVMDPQNAIYEGFLGDAQLVEGQIFKDKREEVRGYYTLKNAIAKWPQFNYFTAGYPLSMLNIDSPYFKEALRWQWDTLDLCAGTKINRQHPDFSPFMNKQTHIGKQRACWNSWVAPYNFQGFFLNMGDMLVKAGDWKTAIIIYQNARLAKNYNEWPFRMMLEKRIRDAANNDRSFRAPQETNHALLFSSGHGCMVCHQTL